VKAPSDRIDGHNRKGTVDGRRNIEVVREMWATYDREGLQGILRFAAPDAEWRPYSAGGRTFTTTADYRRHIERVGEQHEIVEAKMFDVYAHGDWVVVSGRLRLRGPDGMVDNPMHWVHRLHGGRLVFTASFTSLDEALATAGLGQAHKIPA
jgi:ketosteroid isomerase-like protein